LQTLFSLLANSSGVGFIPHREKSEISFMKQRT
jgi:hypothetical protein